MMPTPSATQIQELVCRHWRISLTMICGASRVGSLTRPRIIAMGLCRMLTYLSYPAIGRAFGGRHHTTVLSATRRLRSWIYAGDPTVLPTVAFVRRHFVADRVDDCLDSLVDDKPPAPQKPISSHDKPPTRTDAFVDHCVTAGIRDPVTPEKPGDPDVNS